MKLRALFSDVAQLYYNPESDRFEFDGRELHCGERIEVLVVNDGRTVWLETRLEYAEDWYLVGLLGYQINGLFARMPEV